MVEVFLNSMRGRESAEKLLDKTLKMMLKVEHGTGKRLALD
jgi:hypothetical protein